MSDSTSKNDNGAESADRRTVDTCFDSPRDDSKGFLSQYFDGPYERPFRKRPHPSAETPDGKTLGELVSKIRKE